MTNTNHHLNLKIDLNLHDKSVTISKANPHAKLIEKVVVPETTVKPSEPIHYGEIFQVLVLLGILACFVTFGVKRFISKHIA